MKELANSACSPASGHADSRRDPQAPGAGKKPGRIERYLAEDPRLAAIYARFQRHAAPVITSNYDITSRCNLRCEGCLFFAGTDYQGHHDDRSLDDYDAFFAREAARGVNYPYFAGGEPALEQDRLRIAARHFNRGMIFTNGTLRIDPELEFTIHVSLWGDAAATRKLRGGSVFRKSLANFTGDKR
ncbi:MAG: radical SAM protein, partial [Gammaproteobacteria bacterium]